MISWNFCWQIPLRFFSTMGEIYELKRSTYVWIGDIFNIQHFTLLHRWWCWSVVDENYPVLTVARKAGLQHVIIILSIECPVGWRWNGHKPSVSNSRNCKWIDDMTLNISPGKWLSFSILYLVYNDDLINHTFHYIHCKKWLNHKML